jgi:hypothetical protein
MNIEQGILNDEVVEFQYSKFLVNYSLFLF